MASARTVDLKLESRSDADVTFSAVVKEELEPLSDFLKSVDVKVKNDVNEEMVDSSEVVVRFRLHSVTVENS